ncbi:MAG: formylglycine-generating enzyme family protein [Pontiellaceae bacterium]|jgi:formylglycine-generating enzyme required for sulfatase activity|nr:formylglycine-generating enzyme family protein [Pontiellaceae bacterium]
MMRKIIKSQFIRLLTRSAAVFALLLPFPLFGQQNAAFFRIVSPTNSRITGFSSDGTFVWTNGATGVICTVQRTVTLAGLSNWVDYIQHAVTNPIMTTRLFDLKSPADMAYIPAGVFNMGDNLDEFTSAQPVHSVYVSGFYMGKTEVTKAQWDEIYVWAVTNGYSFTNAGLGKASSHPVHTVNWYDCVKWCNARSEKEGKTPCYTVEGEVCRTGQNTPDCNWSAVGYRLPTEAEWEKAARGGLNGKRFPSNDTIKHTRANYYSSSSYSYDTSSTRGFHPSYDDAPLPYTSPVGSFSANGYGLYDMAGNVYEWCWDWYGSTEYSTTALSNPCGASSGFGRVGRGGDWGDGAGGCRAAGRGSGAPGGANCSIGFRVVRSSCQ